MLRPALLALILAAAIVPPAHADGDPAMDILAPVETRVFMTRAASGSQLESELQTTTGEAAAAGVPVKVAIIANRRDLGAVPELWGRPQTYATFLGAELRFVYNGELLIVMPQGFGLHGPYPRAKALRSLASIKPGSDPTPAGLTNAADRAIRALVTAKGRKLAASHNGDSDSSGGLPLPLIAAGVMVLGGIGGGMLLRRR